MEGGSGGRGEGGVLGRAGGYQDIDMAPSHCSSQTGGTVSPLKSAHKFKKKKSIIPRSHIIHVLTIFAWSEEAFWLKESSLCI